MYNAIAHYIIPPLKEQCYSNKMELQYAWKSFQVIGNEN